MHVFILMTIAILSLWLTNANAQPVSLQFKKQCGDLYFGPFQLPAISDGFLVKATIESCIELISAPRGITTKIAISGVIRDDANTSRVLVAYLQKFHGSECGPSTEHVTYEAVRIESKKLQPQDLFLSIDAMAYKCSLPMFRYKFTLSVPIVFRQAKTGLGLHLGSPIVTPRGGLDMVVQAISDARTTVINRAKSFILDANQGLARIDDKMKQYAPRLANFRRDIAKDQIAIDMKIVARVPARETKEFLGNAFNQRSLDSLFSGTGR